MTAALLDEIEAKLKGLEPKARAEFASKFGQLGDPPKWTPSPGPQSEAYFSEADLLLYGGQAGGGKSDLLLGLAFNAHKRSLMIRRRSSDLSALVDRAIEIHGTRKGYSGQPPKSLRLGDEDAKMEFGGCPHLGDEQAWQGRARDFLGLEEGAQLLEQQVRFLMGWVRTTDPEQRCRTVIASNPPLTDEGQWMFEMFRPWLDPSHDNPAIPGELRWYVSDAEGRDYEVEGPGEYDIGTRSDGQPNKARAMSRTYIPAALDDNPYLRETNYRAVLDSLPEPLRSAMRDGDFTAGRVDDPWQLIPTKWIFEAQNRWSEEPPVGSPMCSIGVDVAQGGSDETVLAARYDWWFAPLLAAPGADTPRGTDVAALVFKLRQNNAAIVIDMGGGYGGAAYEHLKQNLEGKPDGPDRIVHGYNGATTSSARTADRQMEFFNKRAESWWRFREALDPAQQGGSPIALPPDQRLLADLVSPRFEITPRGIKVESKEEIVKRLGRSPDRGDAVVMSFVQGPSHQTHGQIWREFSKGQGSRPEVVGSYQHRKRRRK